jgi:transcriptional regulator with XRE-family HTH domain
MTKTEVLDRLKCNQAQLAGILGISRSAVIQWPWDAEIPPLRQFQLHQLRPQLFRAPAKRQVA